MNIRNTRIYKSYKQYRDKRAYDKKKTILSANYMSGNLDIRKKGFDKLISLIILDKSCKEVLFQSNFYDNYEVVYADDGTKRLPEKLNDAARKANGEYLVFLTDCTEVSDGWLDSLLTVAISEEKVGTVGSEIIDADSRQVNGPEIVIDGMAGEGDIYLKYRAKAKKKRIQESENDYYKTYINTISGMLVSKEVFWDANGFDVAFNENFFETDFCLRLARLGYQNYTTSGSMILCSKKVKSETKAFDRFVLFGKWQFDALGELLNRDMPLRRYDEKEIDILGSMPDNDTKKFWGDYHYALALQTAFQKMGYKANVVCREHWFDRSSAKNVVVLRGKYPYFTSVANDGKRTVISWVISHPENLLPQEFVGYDYVFFASEIMKNRFEQGLDIPCDILMQCTDPSVMCTGERKDRSPELLFVGNSRGVFRNILKDLLPTDHELSVYGREWELYPEVYEHLTGEYIDNSKVWEMYQNAGIVLNDHWDEMRENGLISNRIFDVLAAGGFVISDDVPGIEDVFEGNVVTYKNREDLKEKIDYYLTHDEERDEKVSAGHQIVIGKHTFDQRAKRIAEEFV